MKPCRVGNAHPTRLAMPVNVNTADAQTIANALNGIGEKKAQAIIEEYDFSQMKNGVRGKYAKQYHEGVKLIQLESDVARKY